MAVILDAFVESCIDKLLQVIAKEMSMLRGVQDDLKKLHARLETAGVRQELKQFLRGNDPVEEILALAEATPEVRMIVIGSRRRSLVGKLIMGSTAQRIILGAEVPVVSVKAKTS